MTNLNKEFDLIKQKLDSMSIHEFDDMLDKCGIMTIKPSISSDYVECLKKHFNRNDMYEKESKYNFTPLFISKYYYKNLRTSTQKKRETEKKILTSQQYCDNLTISSE